MCWTTEASTSMTSTLANAEALSALVLFQLAQAGTPIIVGDAPGSTDFRTGNFLEGSPEMVLQAGATGEMAKFYGLAIQLPDDVIGKLEEDTRKADEVLLRENAKKSVKSACISVPH